MTFWLYRYQVKIVPALPSSSESSTSKMAAVRLNGTMKMRPRVHPEPTGKDRGGADATAAAG